MRRRGKVLLQVFSGETTPILGIESATRTEEVRFLVIFN